jgi:hypothetical protein
VNIAVVQIEYVGLLGAPEVLVCADKAEDCTGLATQQVAVVVALAEGCAEAQEGVHV